MSSKFSLNSPVQSPPPVCRKPPAEPVSPIPPIPDRVLIAFAKAYWPIITPPFDVICQIPIYPTIVSYVWEGHTNNPIDNLEIVVIYDAITHTLDVALILKKLGGIVNNITFHDLPVKDPNRFGTRMAEAYDKPTTSRYQVQVFQ